MQKNYFGLVRKVDNRHMDKLKKIVQNEAP